MKRALLTIGLVSLLIAGCAKKAADGTASGVSQNDAVVDVSAQPAPAQQPQPVAPQPVVYDSMTAAPPAPAVDEAATMSAGTYTVKKGDTLYSIARQRYGDGKQWTRIADANPGLDPTKIKVGQTLNIP